MTRRDPTPFGSRHEASSAGDIPYWTILRPSAHDGAPSEHRRSPEFFGALRTRRLIRMRLILASALGVIGVLLLTGLLLPLPLPGLILVVVAAWSISFDVVLLGRVRRTVDEAWVDLARDPE